eukprot:gene493-885_t
MRGIRIPPYVRSLALAAALTCHLARSVCAVSMGWCGLANSSSVCGALPSESFLGGYREGTAQAGPFLVNYGGAHHSTLAAPSPLIFDFGSGTWFGGAAASGAEVGRRSSNVMAMTQDGRAFTLGGYGISDAVLYQLDLQTYKWVALTTSGPAPSNTNSGFEADTAVRAGWMCGVERPSWGLLVAAGSRLLLVYLDTVSEAEYTAASCVSRVFQFDITTLVWTDLTGVDGCGCGSSVSAGSVGCFAWLRATNHAAVGDKVYVVRDDAMFAYDAASTGWARVSSAGSLGCCALPAGASGLTHHTRLAAVAGAADRLWIVTSTSLHLYDTASNVITRTVACSDARRCAAVLYGSMSGTAGCSAPVGSGGWDWSSYEPLIFPLTARRPEGSSYDEFLAYPYRVDELGLLGDSEGIFEDLNASRLKGVDPGPMRDAPSATANLRHHVLALGSDIYVLGCLAEAAQGAAPSLFMGASVPLAGGYQMTALVGAPSAMAVCDHSEGFAVAADADGGKLYMLARLAEGSSTLNTCQLAIYDVAAAAWTMQPVLGEEASTCCCAGHSLTFGQGKLHVVGGYTAAAEGTPECASPGYSSISLDSWFMSVEYRNTAPRALVAVAVVGSSLYWLGGVNGSTAAWLPPQLYTVDISSRATRTPAPRSTQRLAGRERAQLLASSESAMTLLYIGAGTSEATTLTAQLLRLDELAAGGAVSWSDIPLAATTHHTYPNLTLASHCLSQGGAALTWTSQGDGGGGELYSTGVLTTSVWGPSLASLLGVHLRHSFDYQTVMLVEGRYAVARPVVLDSGASSNLTLRGAGTGTGGSVLVPSEGSLGGVVLQGARHVQLRDLTLQGFTGGEQGGALSVEHYAGVSGGCPELAGVAFTDTSVRGDGGALFIRDAWCQVLVANASFTNCSAGGRGGALYTEDGHLSVSDSVFSACSAGDTGGALMASGGSVALFAVSFADNRAAAGGALYTALSSVAATDSSFSRNHADTAGGGICAVESSRSISSDGGLELRRCTLQENVAAAGRGGAVSAFQTDVLVEQGTFASNTATDGGALSVEEARGGSALLINGSTFSSNTASGDGGAVLLEATWREADAPAMAISACAFSSNRGARGGAYAVVSLDRGSLAVTSSTFSSNQATWGGAVYAGVGSLPPDAHTLSSTAMTGNVAEQGGGGAVYWNLACNATACAEMYGMTVNCSGSSEPLPLPNGTAGHAAYAAPWGCADWSGNSATNGGYGDVAATGPFMLGVSQQAYERHNSGEVLDPLLTVSVRDAFNQTVRRGFEGSVEVAYSDATYSSSYNFAYTGGTASSVGADTGVATFSSLAVHGAQRDYVLSATSGSAISGAFSLTVRECDLGEYLSGVPEPGTCSPCPRGTLGTTRGGSGNAANWCVQCDPGHYNDALGSLSCAPCPAGTYHTLSGQAAADACVPCADGYISGSGFSACVACPDGAEDTLHQTCACTRGRYRVAGGGVSDKEAGLSSPATVDFTCPACPAGQFSEGSDAEACTKCRAGTSSSTTGGTTADVCSACGVDTYSLEGATACSACPAHSSDLSRVGCLCDRGYFRQASGSSFTCTACVAGNYSGVLDATACERCPAGTFSTTTASTSEANCAACPAGSISSAGASACTSCPASATDNGRISCSCEPGTRRVGGDTSGEYSCEACPTGTYSADWDSSSCQLCPAGTYSANTSTASRDGCGLCPEGSFSSGGAAACTPCPTRSNSTASRRECVAWSEYGSGWYPAGYVVTLYAQTTDSTDSGGVTYSVVATYEGLANAPGVATLGGSGLYSFQLNHTVPGMYTVHVAVAGGQGYDFGFDIFAARADATQSAVFGCSSGGGEVCQEAEAGKAVSFRVVLRDQFGNLAQDPIRLKLVVVTQMGEDAVLVDGEELTKGEDVTYYTFSMRYLSAGRRHVACALRQNADAATVATTTIRNLTIDVVAGPPVGPMSVVVNTATGAACEPGATTCEYGAPVEAGQELVLEVLTKDAHNNSLLVGGSRVSLYLTPESPAVSSSEVCGETILPADSALLQIEFRDWYSNRVYDASETTSISCVFEDDEVQADASCSLILQDSSTAYLMATCNIIGTWSLRICVNGLELASSGFMLYYNTVPPTVSGSMLLRLDLQQTDEAAVEVLATSALTETLGVSEDLVVILSVTDEGLRRRRLQAETLVNVTYNVVAQTMNDAEEVTAAGTLMEDPGFAQSLSAASSFSTAGVGVEKAVVLDSVTSYSVPDVSPLASKVFEGPSGAAGTLQCFDGEQCPGHAVAAGESTEFHVVLYDEYKNRMTYNPSGGCIAAFRNQLATDVEDTRVEAVNNLDGTYSITLPELTEEGTYEVLVYLGGIGADYAVQGMDSGFLITVTWGSSTNAERTTFDILADTDVGTNATFSAKVAAGTFFVLTVHARDAYGNLRLEDGGDVFVAQLSGPIGVEQLAPPMYSEAESAYKVEGNFTVTGTYTVEVLLGFEQVLGEPTVLEVVPGAAAPEKCEIFHATGTGRNSELLLAAGFADPMYVSTAETGTGLSEKVYVLAYDAFSNLRSDTDDSFSIQVYARESAAEFGAKSSAVRSGGALYHLLEIAAGTHMGGRVIITVAPTEDGRSAVQGTPYSTVLHCPSGFLLEALSYNAQEGYWLAPQAQYCMGGECVLRRVYECHPQSACTPAEGAAADARSTAAFAGVANMSLCAEGYDEGVIKCGGCLDGWESTPSGTCGKCSSSGVGAWMQLLGLMLSLALIFGLATFKLFVPRKDTGLKYDFNDDVHPVTAGVTNSVMHSLQVLGLFVFIFGDKVPAHLRDLLQVVSIVNVPFFRFISASCLRDSLGLSANGAGEFYYEFVFKAVLPGLIVGVAASVWVKASRRKGESAKAAAVWCGLYLMNFVHTGVAATMVSLFHCEQAYFKAECEYGCEDKSAPHWLVADATVQCYTGVYWMFVLAAVLMLGYVLAWPAALFLTLKFCHHSKLVICEKQANPTGFSSALALDFHSSPSSGVTRLEPLWLGGESPGSEDGPDADQVPQQIELTRQEDAEDEEEEAEEEELEMFYTFHIERFGGDRILGIPDTFYAMKPPQHIESWPSFLLRVFMNAEREGSVRVKVTVPMIQVLGQHGEMVESPLSFLEADKSVALYFKMLVGPYRRHLYFWPCVDIFRRMMQTSAIVLLQMWDSDLDIVFALLVSFTALLTEAHLRPFKKDFDDYVSLALLFNAHFVLLCMLVVENVESVSGSAIGWMLSAMLGTLILLILVATFFRFSAA